MTQFDIDPDAVLDYAFDWTAWLADGETIADHDIIASEGVSVDSSSVVAGKVTVWVSSATAGQLRSITCRITTDQGRTDDRTITLHVTDR